MLKTKDLKLNNTVYCCAYVAFMRQNKKTYRLAEKDQFDILWKTLFIFGFQAFFVHALVAYANVSFVLHNVTAL